MGPEIPTYPSGQNDWQTLLKTLPSPNLSWVTVAKWSAYLISEWGVSHSSLHPATYLGWNMHVGKVNNCHAGCEEVSAMSHQRECISRMPQLSANKVAHSGFETQRRCHQKSKTGVSVAHKKDLCPPKIKNKNFPPTSLLSGNKEFHFKEGGWVFDNTTEPRKYVPDPKESRKILRSVLRAHVRVMRLGCIIDVLMHYTLLYH